MRPYDHKLNIFHSICAVWEQMILLATDKSLSKQERDKYKKEAILWRDRCRSSLMEVEEEYQKLNPYEEDDGNNKA